MAPPLTGVRVLEIGGGIPAAFATRWLAGFGAEVARSEGPADALTQEEEWYLLARKHRIEVDDATLRQLALAADIVVEDQKPGTLRACGLDPEELRREKPALVIVSITPFGQESPYADWEATNLVAFAMGGIMSLTGDPHRPPLLTGGKQALYLGGLHGFGAALAAYFGALQWGEGDWVDLSLQEIQAGMLELYGPRSEYEGTGPSPRSGNHVRAVWGLYPCADGFAGVCALERQIPALFALIGDPALREERFATLESRAEHDDELQAILYNWFAERTKAEIVALGTKHRVPLGAVLTPLELLENATLRERAFFEEVRTPEGRAEMPGRPFLGLEWTPPFLESPGESTERVLAAWLGGAE